jgi:hypothetical protein
VKAPAAAHVDRNSRRFDFIMTFLQSDGTFLHVH